MSSEPDLRDLLLEHARRHAVQDNAEPVEMRVARVRAMLIAAFGEAHFKAVLLAAVHYLRDPAGWGVNSKRRVSQLIGTPVAAVSVFEAHTIA